MMSASKVVLARTCRLSVSRRRQTTVAKKSGSLDLLRMLPSGLCVPLASAVISYCEAFRFLPTRRRTSARLTDSLELRKLFHGLLSGCVHPSRLQNKSNTTDTGLQLNSGIKVGSWAALAFYRGLSRSSPGPRPSSRRRLGEFSLPVTL